MIKSLQYLSIALLLTFFSSSLSAQTVLGGEVHGSFEIDGQLYKSADGKNWDYEVLLDVNSDFKRAMNVNLIPHTFLLNGKGEIVWQHTSFSEGAELELIELVRKVARGESLEVHN